MNIRHISFRVKEIRLIPWHHVLRNIHNRAPLFQQVISRSSSKRRYHCRRSVRLILGNTIWVPVASGLIWGNLHAFGGEQSGVSQIWGFFVLSVCFLEWEKKSKGLAILVTGLVHMWTNLVGL